MKSLLKLAVVAFSALVTAGAAAQAFPNKPITLVVPFAPGGGHDATARLLSIRLSEKMGQQVLVVNKPGANAMIGAQFVAQSAPDGYTVLIGSPAETVIAHHIYKNMQYAPRTDLAPVTLAATTPIAFVAHPSLGVSTLPELIALAKRSPGKLSYGSPGNGSVHHLVVEMLKMQTKIDLLHVPYKGAGPATNDVLAGQIPLASVGMAPVTPHIAAGKLKALNAFDEKRLPWDKSLPMAAEVSGLKDVIGAQWMGIFVRAGTPAAIIERLNSEFAAVLKTPAMAESLLKIGVQAVGNSPREFLDFLDAEEKKYSAVVRLTGVTAN
ncbi:tripartite tricarboxylate transporter substrate binding protein [Lacisediminimonas sp.]|uniref:Bug family tripartite tricarboxylate transporter substrate binding protein n=1 Tax=Lacisediminimonas sp. TaxID=3060582 RepID=UPI00271F841C|nr:tripartite tricarboxylate transporter substrate binding protein [Lacisediminimonas sp.]MDO8298988.1 tripartite tricarboxylate transporter substrate binding protein [Lacisediminimonas sp.]MDO9218122.1 tripartite tricarboxylate transporter substrate binding protein [Lacisediminimonas sp.]